MYNSNQNPQGNNFNELMDEICTALFDGELYHERAGNEFRKSALRGFGRWCDAESKGDYESRVCLEKLLRDRLSYAPVIDTANAQKSTSFTINGIQGLKPALEMWLKREEEFAETLTEAVRMAATVDICIYKELCCLLDEVQTEAMRVRLCGMRLDLSGWNGHDVGIVSYLLHEHFEKHPDDKYVNVNLG